MKRSHAGFTNRHRRQGATLVETAITLSAFLMLVLGMLDLGIGVLRYNTLAAAARMGGRAAIVHGSLAPPELAAWDNQTGTDGVSAVILPLLNAEGIQDESITVAVTYADGPDKGTTPNDPGDTVTVQVSVPYKPAFAALLGLPNITLTSRTTMSMAH